MLILTVVSAIYCLHFILNGLSIMTRSSSETIGLLANSICFIGVSFAEAAIVAMFQIIDADIPFIDSLPNARSIFITLSVAMSVSLIIQYVVYLFSLLRSKMDTKSMKKVYINIGSIMLYPIVLLVMNQTTKHLMSLYIDEWVKVGELALETQDGAQVMMHMGFMIVMFFVLPGINTVLRLLTDNNDNNNEKHP